MHSPEVFPASGRSFAKPALGLVISWAIPKSVGQSEPRCRPLIQPLNARQPLHRRGALWEVDQSTVWNRALQRNCRLTDASLAAAVERSGGVRTRALRKNPPMRHPPQRRRCARSFPSCCRRTAERLRREDRRVSDRPAVRLPRPTPPRMLPRGPGSEEVEARPTPRGRFVSQAATSPAGGLGHDARFTRGAAASSKEVDRRGQDRSPAPQSIPGGGPRDERTACRALASRF